MIQEAPSSVAPEDLAEAVNAARQDLAQAVRRADLSSDPFRFVLDALSVTLAVFPRLVERMEAAAEAARAPMSTEEKAALRRDMREGLRQDAGKLARSANRRTAALVGCAIAVAGLAGGAGGYLLGRSNGRDNLVGLNGLLSVDSGAARAWLDLVRANPDPRPALSAGTAWQDHITQRRAVEFRLWTDPPAATAPPRR